MDIKQDLQTAFSIQCFCKMQTLYLHKLSTSGLVICSPVLIKLDQIVFGGVVTFLVFYYVLIHLYWIALFSYFY